MDKKIEIYGFSGKMGTGKNYVAEKLFISMLPKKNFMIMALADHFKIECCGKDGIKYERVFVSKDDETRSLLQKRGTEEGRDVYGPDIWITILSYWIRLYTDRGVERFIITDLRFPNEVEWVKSMGGNTFRIEAPLRNFERLEQESEHDQTRLDVIKNHSSETSLDDYKNFDYIIRNDPEDQPKVPNRIRDIVRELLYQEPVKTTIFCDLDDTICQCKSFYNEIINQVIKRIKTNTNISDAEMLPLLEKYVTSFERRYYTREDFANSLVKVAIESYLSMDIIMNLTREFMDEIYQIGMTVYNASYDPLYPDSLERVREMQKHGQVVLFTLGDFTEQMKKIVNLGLLDFQIEIFTHKDENMFRYLQNKYPSNNYVMIGDSYHRDIIPAMNAGISNLVFISDKPLSKDVDNEIREKVYTVDRLNNGLMDYLMRISNNLKMPISRAERARQLHQNTTFGLGKNTQPFQLKDR